MIPEGFRFEVMINGPDGGNYRLMAQSSDNSYPGVNVWHYLVGTYDAEKGIASIYVDNELVASDSANPLFTRGQRDIRWTDEAQTALTRIGDG